MACSVLAACQQTSNTGVKPDPRAGLSGLSADSTAIFSNTLEIGWQDWSWGSTVRFNDPSTPARFPSSALSVTQIMPWGALSLKADPVLDAAPYAGTAYTSPLVQNGVLEVEDFDQGGEGVAYHDNDAQNKGGLYRPNDGVDLERKDGQAVNIGWAEPGEWLKYSVGRPPQGAGEYTLRTRVAAPRAGGTFHFEFFGAASSATPEVKSTAVTVPSTGGWASYGDVEVKGLVLEDRAYTIKLVFDQNGPEGIANVDRITLVRNKSANPLIPLPNTDLTFTLSNPKQTLKT